MTTTLEWLGTATYRLTIGDLVVFLDAYVDRVPTAPPVALSAANVKKADTCGNGIQTPIAPRAPRLLESASEIPLPRERFVI